MRTFDRITLLKAGVEAKDAISLALEHIKHIKPIKALDELNHEVDIKPFRSFEERS